MVATNRKVAKAKKELIKTLAQAYHQQVAIWEASGDTKTTEDRTSALHKLWLLSLYKIGQVNGIAWWDIDNAIEQARSVS